MRSFVLLGLTLSVAPLTAATINVNSTADVLSNDGSCSLREAIISANTNAPSGALPGECPSGSSSTTDTIQIPAGQFTLTLVGSESDTALTATVGDLDVTQSVNLVGQGATVTNLDAAGLGARVLQIKGTAIAVSLANLRIRNGASNYKGGGIYFSEGASLTLTGVTLEGNTSQDDGGGAWVANTANLTMTDVLVRQNTAYSGGGVRWSTCGACTKAFNMTRVVFQLNNATGAYAYAKQGGGVYAGDGFLYLKDVTVDQNQADGEGGGMVITSNVQADGCTVSNNSAEYGGGGIYFNYPSGGEFTNCTLSGNSSLEEGGAIAIIANGSVAFTHSTITNNTAPSGSAIAFIYSDGAVDVANTIISGTCSEPVIATAGGNIESPGDNCGLIHATDRVAVSSSQLALGALASNGGKTQSHLLGATSVALDTAVGAYCPETDQRGLGRPLGAGCDVGAVEGTWPFVFIDDFESGTLGSWSAHLP